VEHADGRPYRGKSGTAVLFPLQQIFTIFERPSRPTALMALNIFHIYKNKEAFEEREEPLDEDFLVVGLGNHLRKHSL
jgi:hypothetical protein